MGEDSITLSFGARVNQFLVKTVYINHGGQTTPQMLNRFTADVLDLNPAVVVILDWCK
jgi:hypothetical protein